MVVECHALVRAKEHVKHSVPIRAKMVVALAANLDVKLRAVPAVLERVK